jgi:hypothetical protein
MKLFARNTGLVGTTARLVLRLRFTQTKAANHRAQDHSIRDGVPRTRIRVCFHLLHSQLSLGRRFARVAGNPETLRDDAIPSAADHQTVYEHILGKPASAR